MSMFRLVHPLVAANEAGMVVLGVGRLPDMGSSWVRTALYGRPVVRSSDDP
ncbi:hypothetical protein KC207_14830 [Phycicoccus sp. BSK3Z-2]|uniref:Uncharacterized protein n=1 Tax=Phycicoccus avicenniae TaxID=2828860 RepID=A0A941D9R9_9MICO|nr:hypothetical protein [Phycicoccus avicenniae]MBR7744568.1 hypothetical protein [Phycicoccus avicenniae]